MPIAPTACPISEGFGIVAQQQPPTEALAAADILAAVAGFLAQEALAFSDPAGLGPAGGPGPGGSVGAIDTLALADLLALLGPQSFTDRLPDADTIQEKAETVIKVQLGGMQTLSPGGGFFGVWLATAQQSRADVLGFQDMETYQHGAGISPIDTMSSADSAARSAQLSPSENLLLPDVLASLAQSVAQEAPQLAEAYALLAQSLAQEPSSLSEALGTIIAAALQDNSALVSADLLALLAPLLPPSSPDLLAVVESPTPSTLGQMALTESSALADAQALLTQALLQETPALADVLGALSALAAAEASPLAETLATLGQLASQDSVSSPAGPIDALTALLAIAFQESLPGSDLGSPAPSSAFNPVGSTDSYTITDVAVTVAQAALAEGLTLNDLASLLSQGPLLLGDALSLGDVLGTIAGYVLLDLTPGADGASALGTLAAATPNETLTAAEAQTSLGTLGPTDALAAPDALAQLALMGFQENAPVADVLGALAALALAEGLTLPLSESLAQVLALGFADAPPATDVLASVAAMVAIEAALTIADLAGESATGPSTIAPTDTLTATEALQTLALAAQIDPLALSEALANAFQAALADALTQLADLPATLGQVGFTETTPASDLGGTLGQIALDTLTNALTAGDTSSSLAALAQTETEPPSDVLGQTAQASYAEQPSFVDAAGTVSQQGVQDALTGSDILAALGQLGLSDPGVLADTLVQIATLLPQDGLAAQDIGPTLQALLGILEQSDLSDLLQTQTITAAISLILGDVLVAGDAQAAQTLLSTADALGLLDPASPLQVGLQTALRMAVRVLARARSFITVAPLRMGAGALSMMAQPVAPTPFGPFIGSQEANVPFSLDLSPWMGTAEALSSATATVLAAPISLVAIDPVTQSPLFAATPSNVTATLLIGAPIVLGNVVTVVLGNQNAQPGLVYVVEVVATTNQGRKLQPIYPLIPCRS